MHRIVILGAGYAGLTTAVGLKDANARVTLVNRHNYHHLTTMLHQPAAGSRDYQDLHVHIPKVLPPSIDFLRGRIDTINLDTSSVTIYRRPERIELPFDTLVIALGWEPRFYDIPGLKENALSLNSLNDSRLACDRIEESLLALDDNPDETWRSTIVIGGGGLTGVELAGELIDSRKTLTSALDLSPRDIRLKLVEAGPTILPGMDARLIEKTSAYLGAHGVQCITGKRIERIDGRLLTFSDGTTMKAGVVFWTGGVRASAVLEKSGLPIQRGGRLGVNAFLQLPNAPHVYATGDCALCTNSRGEPMPPTAWLAVQHGRLSAQNILRALRGSRPKPFVPKGAPILISIGHRYALGTFAGRLIQGPLAAVLKDMIAFRHLFTIGGLPLAAGKLLQWTPYLLHLHRKRR